ncbi:RNA methyltransferase [Skermania sp. ID1734]|uniref:TrmH family RNA methyltransferase n=1 Tax=Skermania sp. ID1734 TaxID=2597516 RepID=UPI00117E693B|nr:RNA methyltransferase [Skermania sp. ID1734]TSD98030.1 RNA methyltransferase [Skermania sp. ID1734]
MSRSVPPSPEAPLTERTPRVVSAVKLQRAAQRRKTGLFLVEGVNCVEAAIEHGKVREIFHTGMGGRRVNEALTRARTLGVTVSLVSERAAKALGDAVTPPSVVAVCELLDAPIEKAVEPAPRLVAVPVEIGEPGNAGTLIRTADAVGADAVILAGDSVDPHNGKCVRSSAGSIFHLPIVRDRDVYGVLDRLRGAGLTIAATAADGDLDLDDADSILATPTAWLFGNEAHGLDPAISAAADHRVRIPIRGRAESLNLASAAAICLYASSRAQRHR